MAQGTFSLSNVQVGGRVGDLVFLPQSNGRVVVRRMPTDSAPRTALQGEAAARMRAVAAAWQALTIEEGAAWEAYVREAQGWPRPADGKAPTQTYGAFLGLGAKALQLRPAGPVPSLPPTEPFLGDGIVVSVSPGVASQVDGDGESEERRSPLPNGPSGEGVLTFSANAPNAPGVVTELLIQPLAGRHRKPTAKGYRTRGFVAFAPGALSAEVACAPGAYACAIRFVRAATGQETAVVPIGKVTIPA